MNDQSNADFMMAQAQDSRQRTAAYIKEFTETHGEACGKALGMLTDIHLVQTSIVQIVENEMNTLRGVIAMIAINDLVKRTIDATAKLVQTLYALTDSQAALVLEAAHECTQKTIDHAKSSMETLMAMGKAKATAQAT